MNPYLSSDDESAELQHIRDKLAKQPPEAFALASSSSDGSSSDDEESLSSFQDLGILQTESGQETMSKTSKIPDKSTLEISKSRCAETFQTPPPAAVRNKLAQNVPDSVDTFEIDEAELLGALARAEAVVGRRANLLDSKSDISKQGNLCATFSTPVMTEMTTRPETDQRVNTDSAATFLDEDAASPDADMKTPAIDFQAGITSKISVFFEESGDASPSAKSSLPALQPQPNRIDMMEIPLQLSTEESQHNTDSDEQTGFKNKAGYHPTGSTTEIDMYVDKDFVESSGLSQEATFASMSANKHRPLRRLPVQSTWSKADESAFGFECEDGSNYPPEQQAGTFCIEDSNAHPDFEIANRQQHHSQIVSKPQPISTEAKGTELFTEVHPSLYEPSIYRQKPDPIIHYFSASTKPVNNRERIDIDKIFEPPLNTMWKSKFKAFNHLQSEMANTLAFSDDNTIVSAPTGAGKTVLFEMAMARFIGVDLQAQMMSSGSARMKPTRMSKQRKMVYIAPSKALCDERFADWSNRLTEMNLGIEIALVTGDGDPSDAFHNLASAHLTLTTPEKWDSLTRRWTENFFLFGSVKLLMIDEVHLLGDESRGACLESIVCRMKVIQQATQRIKATQSDINKSSYAGTTPEAFITSMRIVAVSATLPNIDEIAAFLDAHEARVFDATYRPVLLKTHVVGLGNVGEATKSHFMFWRNLGREVPQIIRQFSQGRPTIVFCHSKKDTEMLSDELAEGTREINASNSNIDIAQQTRQQKLQRVLMNGIAFHHAGLDIEDRKLVEKYFSVGRIRVLCATSTLAMGVNLPAHLVIIKGTKAWRGTGNGYQDIDRATMLQMIGRAGRPGFDTSGTAVIMTDNNSKAVFQRLVSNGLDPARSQLRMKLDEIINAEVSQRVITSMENALNWIKGTLFFEQLRKNPTSLNVRVDSLRDIDEHLISMCKGSFHRLEQIGILLLRDQHRIAALEGSSVMSQNLVDYQAMQLITELPFDASRVQILKTLCLMEGLQQAVRRSDKKALNELHKNVKYKLDGPPSKVRVQEKWQKAFVLIQSSIGGEPLVDPSLRQEAFSMVENATRMLVAIEEYSVKASRHGGVIVQSLSLRRSLSTSIWSPQDGMLSQFGRLDQETVKKLQFNGISTFEDVVASSERQIETAAGRKTPFGKDLRLAASKVLNDALTVCAEVAYAEASTTPSHIICRLKRRGDYGEIFQSAVRRSGTEVIYSMVVYLDQPCGCLLFKREVCEPCVIEIPCPAKFSKVVIHIVASIVGLDDRIELEGNVESSKSKTNLENEPEAVSAKILSRSNKTLPIKYVDPSVAHSSNTTDTVCADNDTEQLGKMTDKSNRAMKGISITVTPSPKVVPIFGCNPNPGNHGDRYKSPKSSEVACTQKINNASTEEHTTDHNAPWVVRSTSDSLNSNDIRFYRKRLSSSVALSNNVLRGRNAWKQAKREQERSQQRAFASRSENPFSKFHFDPNDTESLLDDLTMKNAAPPDDFEFSGNQDYNEAPCGPSYPDLETPGTIPRYQLDSRRFHGGIFSNMQVATNNCRTIGYPLLNNSLQANSVFHRFPENTRIAVKPACVHHASSIPPFMDCDQNNYCRPNWYKKPFTGDVLPIHYEGGEHVAPWERQIYHLPRDMNDYDVRQSDNSLLAYSSLLPYHTPMTTGGNPPQERTYPHEKLHSYNSLSDKHFEGGFF